MSVLTSQKTDCLSIITTKSLMHLEQLLLLVIQNCTTQHTHARARARSQRVENLYVDLNFEQKRNWRNYETVSENLRFAEPFSVDF